MRYSMRFSRDGAHRMLTHGGSVGLRVKSQ